jgi:hypothetical protein
MADNVGYTQGDGTKIASRNVTYSGDSVQAQVVGLATFTGADDAKIITDIGTSNPLPITAPGGIAVTGALTDAELRASAVPVSVPLAVSATILTLTTAATGTNWTAFGSSVCDALDLTNSTSVAIEYRRGGAGNGMQVLSGASRLIVGITNANQIEVRRVDTSNTQVAVQAEALVA